MQEGGGCLRVPKFVLAREHSLRAEHLEGDVLHGSLHVTEAAKQQHAPRQVAAQSLAIDVDSTAVSAAYHVHAGDRSTTDGGCLPVPSKTRPAEREGAVECRGQGEGGGGGGGGGGGAHVNGACLR